MSTRARTTADIRTQFTITGNGQTVNATSGAHDTDYDGQLRYVGTGFRLRDLDDLLKVLAPLARSTSPVANPVPRDRARGVHWVEPRIVGEVEFRHLTDLDRRSRHTAWRGLRMDKTDPGQVWPPS
ncbi:ATP dependent DNA ligase [Amycolatopsis echigonensis]|uniref:ATP dependent DNA ligase n=1 Tax=Amycolatopsis echigonensis TaxID=2576905 RepID=UPI0028B1AD38|nr:hypothetical protein [Amycolatopsis echigonensis]